MTACQNTPKTPALDMANFDLSVAPNADFYEYATGGWQKNNPLKPEYARYGSFDILRDNNEKRINELFSGMTQQKAEPGSVEQKISDLYKMGLDSVRLNAEGAAPIKAAVDGILAIGDRSQLTAAVARLHSSIANPFFGVGVQSDLMNSDINALYASQPDLIMGDRDYYLDPENESIRTAYKEYLGKIFRLSGVPEADIDKAVAGVLSIETKLAEKNWSSVELRNIPAMYNPTKKADFEKAYDAIDWAEYYKTMGIGDFEQIIVTTPSALANANELMKTAPLEEIRYYLAAQYIGAAASYLSDDFINASFDFFGRVMSGKQEQKPRWKRAMSVPNGTLSEAVGEMYVAKYFPEKDKVRMMEMVKNLQTALSQHLQETRLALMTLEKRLAACDPNQRLTALEKRLGGAKMRLEHQMSQRISALTPRLGMARIRLDSAAEQNLQRKMERLHRQKLHLQALNPEAVLERGYALVLDGGRVLPDRAAARTHSQMTLRFRDGEMRVMQPNKEGAYGSEKEADV